jgi:electron transfer flavoprotein-quinone oxidoreductase
MNERSFDIVVVGAGCAGPAAARRAAEKGLKTLLLEKANTPGEKNVSGTCLQTTALSDPDLNYLLAGPVEREIREMRTYQIHEGRTTVFHEIPARGILLLSIRRDHFDAWHTEQARMAGATVKLGTAVQDIVQEDGRIAGVVADGTTYHGRVVIDAGGVNSIVGRKAGLIGRRSGESMILYVTANVHLGKDVIDERFGDCIEYYHGPGFQNRTWPWIFPKRDVVTVGTGGYMNSDFISGDVTSVNDYMQNFMNHPIVADKLRGGTLKAWGCHLEFDDPLPANVADNLILTGEAGGYVAPFLGEGMPEAFFTGIYAADAAAEAMQSGDTSAETLGRLFHDRIEQNAFLQAFYHVATKNKEAILAHSDDEITTMMQNVAMSGGFITSTVHHNWMAGADEEDLDRVQEARDFLDFITPYRSLGEDFETLYEKWRAT